MFQIGENSDIVARVCVCVNITRNSTGIAMLITRIWPPPPCPQNVRHLSCQTNPSYVSYCLRLCPLPARPPPHPFARIQFSFSHSACAVCASNKNKNRRVSALFVCQTMCHLYNTDTCSSSSFSPAVESNLCPNPHQKPIQQKNNQCR